MSKHHSTESVLGIPPDIPPSTQTTIDDTTHAAEALTPEHRTMLLKDSGILPEVIAERGYRTCSGYSELKSLGMTGLSKKSYGRGGMLLPIHLPDGTPAEHWLPDEQRMVPFTIYRPDIPLMRGKGRERKYLHPTGGALHLDVHPRCQPLMRDPTRFLWITEGTKKGDALVSRGACAVALQGVESWKTPDWRDIDLRSRQVGIVFDSDVMQKIAVRKALDALTMYITAKGAQVQHAYLPSEDGEKVGVDDYLLTHSLSDLEALLESPRQGKTIPYTDWRAGLLTTKSGMPLETFGNLQLCIASATDPAHLLWYNLVQDCAMVGDTPLSETYVEQAATAIEQAIRLPIRHLALVRTALVAQCRQSPRDPIKDWLESLPAWDGHGRLLTWLRKYTGAAGTPYVGETGQLWLVSMVARALEPGCQCRSVIVLMGQEDIGKSKLVKLLASAAWYREVSGSLEGKEAHILMKGAWVVELSEMSSMGKTEENRLKSFITMANDEYVPKYSNDPIKLARRTILVGTLNPEGDQTFLRGQTGSTRFYPVAVTDIKLDMLEPVRDQLFAEALVYFRAHPDDWWRLSSEADTGARDVREDHRRRSVYEEALGAWLEGLTEKETCWQHICEHFLHLEAKERWKDTLLQREIAQAMRACGWHQEKPRRLPGYGLVRPWTPNA